MNRAQYKSLFSTKLVKEVYQYIMWLNLGVYSFWDQNFNVFKAYF